MKSTLYNLLNHFKGTILHPQWLSDRYHIKNKNLLKNINKKIILDIGSGDSNYEEFINNNKLYRLDYYKTNKIYNNTPDIYADACNLPFKNSSVDIVFLFEVIEHIYNHLEAISEAHRVIKKDGLLYISVPFIYPEHDAPNDFRRFTRFGLLNLLDDYGFKIMAVKQNGNSIVVSIQTINLCLLEIARDVFSKSSIIGIFIALFIYPICLLNNLFALPFIEIPWNSASSFGFFVISMKR